ncbi:Asp23/Gls24 family envelope stress response protein [Collinsella sp. AGMB00827]|uniref:Asp23/Gls24 family envelope stress response protein n=1 Tax=Collinsella ureilytica TaxID=2869515 RepID=A0ABS7ML55_9ACTN|nr:Asp23/Gls24 family envelope stress response protein [Collinsella urealyticum]MBY4798089.1 Asp23/Gls24 family envelope stress response protein [Collinsella urealyticum]
MSEEISIAGIGIAPEVLMTLIARAVEEVAGVASVGSRDLAANLVSMLSARKPSTEPAVEVSAQGEELCVRVRVTVFFGYRFQELASQVRAAVASAVDAQVGVGVSEVDVVIDGLVFPKE